MMKAIQARPYKRTSTMDKRILYIVGTREHIASRPARSEQERDRLIQKAINKNLTPWVRKVID